ncbi:hypothetical protein W03_01740 [Nitrosomonas sp. PY1]|uniref:hypothetical protein n=1 Tax=Nitrosomonas sp. PY1 TaxID=1803906 RepID=UPI001FC82BCB|nr:hypothetical protein [Nitrosomonas sp. PY1]GKS68170.1 hypothetical protein W03_01740 [Nitrosomonas sp. PY1]
MRTLSFFIILFSLGACNHLPEALKASRETPQNFNQQFPGEHSVLAKCTVNKLRSDGNRALYYLHFKYREFSDREASEIVALDTRYLSNIYPAYAPSNPDAVQISGGFYTESIETYSHEARLNERSQMAFVFSLVLEKSDYASTAATLDGDLYAGEVGWKVLESCALVASEQPPTP